jgi:hypothetical protein
MLSALAYFRNDNILPSTISIRIYRIAPPRDADPKIEFSSADECC